MTGLIDRSTAARDRTRIVASVVAIVATVYVVVTRRDGFFATLAGIEAGPLVLAIALLTVGNLLSVEAGRLALASRDIDRTRGQLAPVILVSNLTKYIPGFVAQALTHVRLSRGIELDTRSALSVWVDVTLLVLASSGVLGGGAAIVAGGSVPRPLAIAAFVLGCVGLVPHVRYAISRILRVGNQNSPIRRRAQFWLICLSLLGMAMYGLHGLAVVASVTPHWQLVGYSGALAAFAGGWAIGLIAIVFPAGFGPREAVIVAILATWLDFDTALAVAALGRAALLVADVLPGVAASLIVPIVSRSR